MKDVFEMSELAQEVAENIDNQLDDCKDLAREGMLSGGMLGCVVRAVVNTLDNWNPRLDYSTRCEVLDWFQSEYGICL